MKRRFFNLFLVLGVLSAQLSVGSPAFACQMDGEIHRSCCCKGEASGLMPDARSGQEDCGCCQERVVEAAPASVCSNTVIAAPTKLLPLAFSGHLASANIIRLVSVRRRTAPDTGTPRTPPLFVLNDSFLI